MLRSSFASSGASPTSPERNFQITEHFQTLPASLGPPTYTRLQQKRRKISICDSDAFVSTAIAPTGWLAAATSSEIRLYDLENRTRTQDINSCTILRPRLQPKSENIRAIALSADLLAVATHFRLIVYEYRENGGVGTDFVEDVRVDQKTSWTPRSVSIFQVNSTDARQSAAAWIAVGGEGINGVKLFQYSQKAGWNAQSDCRLNLKCPPYTGLVRSVGFSTFVHMNTFFAFAVTSENRVVCWHLGWRETGSPSVFSRTEYDANTTQAASPHRGEITAVSVFESPSQIPYILVAIDQRPGSQLIRSFIAPLGAHKWRWRLLPDKVTGRHIRSAAVSSNGRYLAVVDDGTVKLLTLRGAYEGGLTCHSHVLEWPSSLKDTAKDTSAICLSTKESLSCIEVTGLDGRGHIVSARISVPGMPVTELPSLSRPILRAAELPAQDIIREICGKEVRPLLRTRAMTQRWQRPSGDVSPLG